MADSPMHQWDIPKGKVNALEIIRDGQSSIFMYDLAPVMTPTGLSLILA